MTPPLLHPLLLLRLRLPLFAVILEKPLRCRSFRPPFLLRMLATSQMILLFS